MSTNSLRLLVNFASTDKLSGSLRSIIGLGQKGSERLAAMKKEARALDRELGDVRAEIGRSSGNATQLLDRERELMGRIARTNTEMEKRVSLLKTQDQTNAIRRKGSDMRAAGVENVIQGAGIAAPLLIAARSAMGYEKQLNLIAQKTDMSEAATRRFGDRILEVSGQTSQASDNLIQAADFLAGKGINVKAIEAMLPTIGKFATAWDADVVDASKAAYAGLLSLKVPLNETARSLEIMAAAGKAGGFEVKDMAQYFPQLSANLATFGGQGLNAVGQLSSALQILESKTGDGAIAANNLNNLLLFVKSKEGKKNFAKFGIDVVDTMKNVWPAPSARGILKCSDQSASTYAVSWVTPWPRWTSARLEPQ
jgi:hypothetical protein